MILFGDEIFEGQSESRNLRQKIHSFSSVVCITVRFENYIILFSVATPPPPNLSPWAGLETVGITAGLPFSSGFSSPALM